MAANVDLQKPTHKTVRQEVSRGLEAEISRLRTFHPLKRIGEILFFTLLFVAGVLLINSFRGSLPAIAGYIGWIGGTLLAALAINAMVLLMHEGMHSILFKDARANRWVSAALGVFFLMSYSAYRVMHIRHHDYLGDPRDPDDYHNYTSSPTLIWIMHYTRLFLGSFLYIFLIPGLGFKYGNAVDRRRIISEYLLLGILYSIVLLTVPAGVLFWSWFLPLILVGFMVNIRGFTQHGITDAHDPYLASRSIYPNRLISFFLLNENLHLEHHLFPEIPSYHLPALNRLIGPRLPRKVVGDSYLGFLATFIRRTFRLDESIIGLQEKSHKAPGPDR